MSVLDYGVPLSRNLAPFSSDLGGFWGSGAPDYPLSSPHTALEAQALSSLFNIDTTDIFQEPGEGGDPRRREGGRKRKMSSREDPAPEQPPKRRRETDPYPRPQYVAPSELTTSPSEMRSYGPLPSPREPTGVRRSSTGPAYEQRGPVEPSQTYRQSSQYLQPPPETDWSRSAQHRADRSVVLPSISSSPGYPSSPNMPSRPPTSYSVSSVPSGYAPAVSQTPHERHASYSYASTGYDGRHTQRSSASHSPMPSGSEQAQQEADDRPKPRCWEHGCNGRQFSTFSNLLRHQRERAGSSTKYYCPRCGAEFTRTTARNGHLAHAKCKPQRSPGPSGGGSGQ